MKKLILNIIINSIAVALVAHYVSGISYEGGNLGLVAVALVLGVINVTIKPIISLFALPVTLLTMGLFSLIINGGMFYITSLVLENFIVKGAWFPGVEYGPVIIGPFYIPVLGVAVIGALVMSVISRTMAWFVD
ncbi:phage holin family protein [Patescibacteria group bacterium]|nr:phage holin family protein [Patescibacteria group bacterium]